MAPILSEIRAPLHKRYYYYYYYYRPSAWIRYGRWIFLSFVLIFIALAVFFLWLRYVRQVRDRKIVPGPNMMWAVPNKYLPADNGSYPQTQQATDYQAHEFYKQEPSPDDYGKGPYVAHTVEPGSVDHHTQSGYVDSSQNYSGGNPSGPTSPGGYAGQAQATSPYYNAQAPSSPPPQQNSPINGPPYQNASFSHVNPQYAPPASYSGPTAPENAYARH